MIVGIDASNIRAGGGVTHLAELLSAASPGKTGIDKAIVWASSATLASIKEHSWLVKQTHPWLDKSLLWRLAWQLVKFPGLLLAENCGVAFVPGGAFSSCPVPVVTMNQNLLPFDWREIRRFGPSLFFFKLLILRYAHTAALRRADGVVFLTEYAKAAVVNEIDYAPQRSTVIFHGVDRRFQLPPRTQKNIRECTRASPFALLYVSHVWPYKHPWTVARAVAILRAEGWPIRLDVVGGGYPPSISLLLKTIRELDPGGEFLSYAGDVSHGTVSLHYHRADLFVFASSCETFGQIVTEAMSAGLPVVCSDRAAMHEVLGEDGRYFDPENLQSLVSVLRDVINSQQLRTDMAVRSYQRAMKYSWARCAEDTFSFIARVAKECGAGNEGME